MREVLRETVGLVASTGRDSGNMGTTDRTEFTDGRNRSTSAFIGVHPWFPFPGDESDKRPLVPTVVEGGLA